MSAIAISHSELTIDIIVGGSAQVLAQYPATLNADIVLVCDTKTELDQIRSIDKHPHFYKFPLAEGETTDTLFAQQDETVRALARGCANSNADDGLAQISRAGNVAGENLSTTDSFVEFRRDRLMPLLMELSNGNLRRVRTRLRHGLGGGTGCAGGSTIKQAIDSDILSHTSATICSEDHAIGALSYLSLGNRIAKNAAPGVADSLAHTISPQRDAREARLLILTELPATGRDRAARNRFVLAMTQAETAGEVSEVLNRMRPNHAFDGPLGGVEIWQVGFHRPLDPRTEVAPFIAAAYAQQLLQSLKDVGAEEGLVDQLLLTGKQASVVRGSLKSLIDNAASTETDALVDAICAPGFRLIVQVSAMLRDGRALGLTKASATWAMPPETSSDLERRLIEQASCLAMAQRDLKSLFLDHESLLDNLFDHTARFRKIHRQLTGRSFLTKLRGATSSTRAKLQTLQETAEQMRGTSDLLVENEAELAAIAHAIEQLKIETEFLHGKATGLANRLSMLVPKMAHDSERLVLHHPIDFVFPAFWRLAQDSAEDDLLRLVCSAVRQVTISGLARIVGAPEARPDAVAKAIAARQFEVLGPPWGGSPLANPKLVMHVLPPVDEEFRAALRKLITAEDPQSLVCFADSVTGVVNSCTLFVEPVAKIDQVLTSFYMRHLLDAHRDSRAAFFFPQGVRSAEALGVQLT